MASAKALAVSSSKRHPRIAVVTSPRRRRRRHHRRIVVRAERCRIATRAERERSSPSSPRCRRSAVMPSRRPCLSPSSLPVSSSSPSSERRATPRRVVAASSHPRRRRRRLFPYFGYPPRPFEVATNTTRRWSAAPRPYLPPPSSLSSPLLSPRPVPGLFARRRHRRIVIVAI